MIFAPFLDHEPKGIESLRELGKDMYEETTFC
jgi:hypothetical protein